MRSRNGRLVATRSRDEGFTIVEVILAMVIVLIVMTALIGVLLSSLTTVTQARQRQTATALATQALERLRALPYDDVTQPNSAVVHPSLTNITAAGTGYAFTPAALSGVNEPLVVNDWSGQLQDQTVDGVTYRIQTYVTTAPATASGEQAFNLTAIVSWTSNVSNGERTTAQRSVAYSPAGCLSTAQSPFAAPCQSYFTAQAGSVPSGLSVANPFDSDAPIEGFDSGRLLDFSFAVLGTNLLIEQTASATANAQSSGASTTPVVGAVSGSGGLVANAAVDSDPASAAGQTDDVALPGQTSGAQSLSGSAGSLRVRPSSADDGRAAAAVAATSALCTGSTGTGLVTGSGTELRPCSSATVEPEGSAASLVWDGPGGLGAASVPLVTADPSGTPWRAVAANLAAANAGACATGAGPGTLGCAHASVRRAAGDLTIGGTAGVAAFPAGWDLAGPDYLVKVDDLVEAAVAEDGTGVGTPSYTRTGTVTVWRDSNGDGVGDGHEVIDLAGAGATTIGIPATSFTYTGASGSVFLTYEGSVTVQPPTSSRTPAVRSGNAIADCKAEACVTRVSGGGGVLVNLTVTITSVPYDPASVDPPLGRFTVGTNLGGLTAAASYKAAPNA